VCRFCNDHPTCVLRVHPWVVDCKCDSTYPQVLVRIRCRHVNNHFSG
jgi:hypothetical protein